MHLTLCTKNSACGIWLTVVQRNCHLENQANLSTACHFYLKIETDYLSQSYAKGNSVFQRGAEAATLVVHNFNVLIYMNSNSLLPFWRYREKLFTCVGKTGGINILQDPFCGRARLLR